MMDMQQRSEFLSGVYRVQGDLFALKATCQATTSLHYGVQIQQALEIVNNLIEEMKPEQFNNPRTDGYFRKNVYGLSNH